MIKGGHFVTAVVLAAASVSALVVFYSWRCDASPAINFNVLAFAVLVQSFAIALVASQIPAPSSQSFRASRRWLLVAGIALALSFFVMARYALNFSDALGQPNWYKSVGLRCAAQ